MTNGFYWYFRGDGDAGDLDSDEPQIVRVMDGRVFVCGGDLSTPIEDAHGRYVGQLEPPSAPRETR